MYKASKPVKSLKSKATHASRRSSPHSLSPSQNRSVRHMTSMIPNHTSSAHTSSMSTSSTRRVSSSQSRLIQQPSHSYKLNTPTVTSRKTFSTAVTPTTPCIAILSHPIYPDFDHERDQDSLEQVAPTYAVKLFHSSDTFQTPPMTLRFPHNDSLLSVAKKLQATLPGKPAFVSFSVVDPHFKQLYYPPSHAFDPPRLTLYRGISLDDVEKAVVQNTSPDASGVPPYRVNFQNLRGPITGARYFIPPMKKETIDFNYLGEKLKSFASRQKPPVKQPTTQKGNTEAVPSQNTQVSRTRKAVITNSTSPYVLPETPHTPLNYESSFYDFTRGASPHIHVSYDQQQLDTPSMSEISKVVKQMGGRVMYPEISNNLVTVSYKVTDGTQIHPLGHQIGMEKYLVVGLFALLLAVKAYVYYQDQYESPSYDQLTEFTQHAREVMDEAVQIRMKLESVPFSERYQEYRSGNISFKQLFDPFYKLHAEGKTITYPKAQTAFTAQQLIEQHENVARKIGLLPPSTETTGVAGIDTTSPTLPPGDMSSEDLDASIGETNGQHPRL